MANIPPRSSARHEGRFAVEPGNERPTTRPFDAVRTSLTRPMRSPPLGLWSDAANRTPSLRPRLTPVPTPDAAAALREAVASSRMPALAPATPPRVEAPEVLAAPPTARRPRETVPVRAPRAIVETIDCSRRGSASAPASIDAPIVEITPLRRPRANSAKRARATRITAPIPRVDR